MIELNHAAAVSMVDGPARALDLIDALAARGGLNGYELLPAVRADLLRRLGRHEAAREAYLAATAATQLEPLRRLYARRIAEMGPGPVMSGLDAGHPRLFLPCYNQERGCLASPGMTRRDERGYFAGTTALSTSSGKLASSACSVDMVE